MEYLIITFFNVKPWWKCYFQLLPNSRSHDKIEIVPFFRHIPGYVVAVVMHQLQHFIRKYLYAI